MKKYTDVYLQLASVYIRQVLIIQIRRIKVIIILKVDKMRTGFCALWVFLGIVTMAEMELVTKGGDESSLSNNNET